MTTREQLSCESVLALAGAYALDAVTGEEAAAIREHLETCADCRAEVAEMVAVAMALPLAVESVEPPAGLKQRIMDGVAAESADTGIVSLPSSRETRTGWAADINAGRDAAVGPRAGAGPAARRSFWSSRAWPAAAAAALVAAIGLGGYSYNLQQQTPRVYTLHVQAAGQATGKLVYVPGDHTTIVTVDGIPDPGAAKTYQMWLLRDGRAESVGTMNPGAGGSAGATVNKDLSGYQQFAVTVEPAGGSIQPTGPRVVTQAL